MKIQLEVRFYCKQRVILSLLALRFAYGNHIVQSERWFVFGTIICFMLSGTVL